MQGYDLTDFEWGVIQPLLPNKPRGVPRVVRQQRLDHTPLETSQIASLHLTLPTVWKHESQITRFRSPIYECIT